MNQLTSHERYLGRYFDPARAARYAGRQNNTLTHGREMRCISAALKDVTPGTTVLDIPCGAGRLLPDLVARGYEVTLADVAPPMLEEARKFATSSGLEGRTRFVVADALDTGLADNEFDIVICNRLFHHFVEPEVRVRGLAELGRVASRYLVVSFFCSLSLDALTFHLADALRSRKSTDRIPISYWEMKRNVLEAGLQIVGVYPMRFPVSRQWYLKLSTG